MQQQIPTEESFGLFELSPQLRRAVKDLGYADATDIQSAAIPLVLAGRDVIGRSSTGTGKTAAFGIPAVELVDGELKRPQVLVLSPTRELALQITGEMQKYAKYKEGVSVATVYGGASMQDQIWQLKRANIVVGTPGRLMDHMRRGTLKLDDVKMVVLDEADEMLSMGFIEDIETILAATPDARQTVLFSATMPPPILKIAETFLKEPEVVDVREGTGADADIEQTYYYVPQHKKLDATTALLQYDGPGRVLVFCNTKAMVDELAAALRERGLMAMALHGDMAQATRTQVMQTFRAGGIEVLVATDVAARGIDVSDIDVVINYDLPLNFEYYVHRIGRTGRAGRRGVSRTLICNGRQLASLRHLMRFTGKEIKEHRLPTGDDMMARAVQREAAALLPQMAGEPGRAAGMLVRELLGKDERFTPEKVALALAEKLIGGDSRFKSIVAPEEIAGKRGPGARRARGTGESNAPWASVTADIGRAGRVTPHHFVRAIAELLDIPGTAVGKIDIGEQESRIGLRQDMAEALLKLRRPVKLAGREVHFKLGPAPAAVRPHRAGAHAARPRAEKPDRRFAPRRRKEHDD